MFIILRYPLPFGIHDAEIVLCDWIALFGRPEIPEHRLLIVLFNSLALEVDKAHHGLRGNVPLFRRLAKPQGRLLVILVNPPSARI